MSVGWTVIELAIVVVVLYATWLNVKEQGNK